MQLDELILGVSSFFEDGDIREINQMLGKVGSTQELLTAVQEIADSFYEKHADTANLEALLPNLVLIGFIAGATKELV